MTELICSVCREKYPVSEPRWCIKCGNPLDLIHEPCFPLDRIKERKLNMWRYREAIPLDNNENIVSLDEGYTALLEIGFDGKPVLVKQDHLFPTGSFKDRGASVMISKVKELGIKKIVEDSSGNAGAAVAAYSAAAGIECDIYVPSYASAGKLVQIEMYGANLVKIDGTRDDTAEAAFKAAKDSYFASHSWNPFFFHGIKTFAFEVCEQLGWQPPDSLILPIGNGSLILGTYIGFSELHEAEIIKKMPVINGVQSVACCPIYYDYMEHKGEKIPHRFGKTIAEGIAINHPVRRKQILAAINDTGGTVIIVEEDEIIDSLKRITGKGFFIEPTSAATAAAVFKYVKTAPKSERIVSIFTGTGLKASDKILEIYKK